MALQPPSGLTDLNPQQVEKNQLITKRLADVYRLWGYSEVSPPRVDRLDTLMAGGAIPTTDIIRLVSDDPLGLRPEMTASIARAACTRLSEIPRPLRLWASGTVFESRHAAEGGHLIEEKLVSGVELLGSKGITAELELLSLLFEALKTVKLNSIHKPQLLVGHTGLIDLLLQKINPEFKNFVRKSLTEYDRLSIEKIELPEIIKSELIEVMECRGKPSEVLNNLQRIYGNQQVTENLKRLFTQMEELAINQEITLQLDPTFLPHFELYTGIVFQLVCQGIASPVVIARGGRYDDLVYKCGGKHDQAAGVGFSFSIDEIRELCSNEADSDNDEEVYLIAYGKSSNLEKALNRQQEIHKMKSIALVELDECKDEEEAKIRLKERRCNRLEWLN